MDIDVKAGRREKWKSIRENLVTVKKENELRSVYQLRTLGAHEEKGDCKGISGFIFICSAKIKPQCFQYHVFPAEKFDDVSKIVPGIKLFLYDFDSKLLHGIYIAKSRGEHSLEPDAFGGKFPAQVKFEIFKECLPLPESKFRDAIPGNYNEAGLNISSELSNKQVNALCSLFRPLYNKIPFPSIFLDESAPYPPLPYADTNCNAGCSCGDGFSYGSYPQPIRVEYAKPDTGYILPYVTPEGGYTFQSYLLYGDPVLWSKNIGSDDGNDAIPPLEPSIF